MRGGQLQRLTSTGRREDAVRIRHGRPLLDAFLILLFVAIVAGTCSRTALLQQFDWGIYDTLLDLLPLPASRDVPLVIGIDERSLAGIGPWPWPRRVYAQAVQTLTRAGVQRIGIDVLMTEGLITDELMTQASVPGLQSPDSSEQNALRDAAANDALLAKAIRAAPHVYMPLAIDEQQSGGQLIEVLPAPAFIAAGARLGHVHLEADDDGVVRGVYLWQGIDAPHWPHLALAMTGAQPGSHTLDAASRAMANAQPLMSMANTRSQYRLLRFVRGRGALPRISFIDLLHGRVPARQLRGRTVLIGMTAAAGADTIATPVTRAGRPMAGVEFNANVYTAIRDDGLIEPLSERYATALSALLAALAVLCLPFLRPRPALLVALAFSAAPALLSFLLLAWQNIWFAPAAAMAGSLLTYPLWSWRRLDQTLRSVGEEVAHLHITTEQTRLGSDLPDPAQALRFIHAVLPETRTDAQPRTHTDPHAAQWLASLSQLAATRSLAVDDSFEVLTRRLDALHSSIALQTDALAAARRSLEGMRDGVVLLGDFGQMLFANTAARQLLGIGQNAAIDALDTLPLLATLRLEQSQIQQYPQPSAPLSPPFTWANLMRALYVGPATTSPEGTRRNERANLPESASSDVRHITLEAKTGDHREVLLTLSRIVAGVLITLVDISALRQAERAHRETLSFLSHDLRSPIVSLLALSGSLRDRHPDPDVQDSLGRIQRYAKRSLENAEQFLQMTRIENEPTMTRYELDLLAAAENAASQLSDQVETLGGRIEVTTDTDEGVWVLGSGEFIERAILNLISNALKYGPTGDRILVRVLENGDEAVCEVHDNGPGIPAHELPNLFNPYYQRPEHRGRRDGVGLGLRFVQVVAQRHNGRVEVQSAPRQGTTFRLVLPRLVME